MDDAIDNTELYRNTRVRMTQLCRTLGGDGSGRVPCCPEWTVTDLVSHTTGVCADILAGNIAAAGTDPWTKEQVDARRGRSLEEVLVEWEGLGPKVEAALAGGHLPDQLLADTVTHEQDLRGAFNEPGYRDDPALLAGLRFLLDGWAGVDEPRPIKVVSGPYERLIGQGEPQATLSVEPFELMRAFTGRRSLEQVKAYDWGGADPSPWLPMFSFGPFTPRSEPVLE